MFVRCYNLAMSSSFRRFVASHADVPRLKSFQIGPKSFLCLSTFVTNGIHAKSPCCVGCRGLETFRIQASSAQHTNVFELSSAFFRCWLIEQTFRVSLPSILRRKRCSTHLKFAFRVGFSAWIAHLQIFLDFRKSNSSGKTSFIVTR